MAQTRTKFLTREQRRNLKSNSTQVKDPFTTRTKTLSASQRQQLSQNRQEVDKAVQEVEKQVKQKNFRTLKEAKEYISKLDPVIRNRLSTTPEKQFQAQLTQLQ